MILCRIMNSESKLRSIMIMPFQSTTMAITLEHIRILTWQNVLQRKNNMNGLVEMIDVYLQKLRERSI